MNTPLRRLASVVIVMFFALVVASTWVQVFQAPDLNADQRNVRTLYREYGNPRGPIVVGDQVIASSVPIDDSFGYQRTYANGPMYAPVTGYYSIRYHRHGIEEWMNTELDGSADSLFYTRLEDLFTGRQTQGASVELTIDPVVQQTAWDALGDQRGAVVAIDTRTGAILAMVSKPSYDPTVLATHDYTALDQAWAALQDDSARPMDNRAIAGNTYPPGSTFKLVTAAAALEAGVSPDAQLPAPTQLDLPQTSVMLGNFGGESCSSTGTATLAEALRTSCNTAFAQLGMDLGDDALRAQADAFGFDTPLNVPMKVTESSFPDNPDAPQTALSAIGQYEVRVTPLQMAMVAAAIANDGVPMRPYLVQTVRSQDLTVVAQAEPTELDRAISARTASTLTDMMVGVVDNGTGTAAQIDGVQVAGKTGTAQTSDDAAPHAWFTSFAPADNPRVAVAVIVENGGSMGNEATGGAVAAPIARATIEAALR